jgi:NAD(P)-dependent dehydrogenase (short-subunit alcohol dehydrogenase family)
MYLKPIHEQVVVIVGASSGIGRDVAKKFAQRGAKVVISARSEDGLASLLAEIKAIGGNAIMVSADVTNYEQIKTVADQTVAQFDHLDTWVHLAATGLFASFDDITPDEFKRVIDVNLMGQVHGAMVALPYLKLQGCGSLIHITSMEARRSMPFQSPYSASKHGVTGFLDALRLELQHQGYAINVANILPSVINTPFYNKGKTRLGVKPTGIPPYYQPEIVSDAILFAAEHFVRDSIVGDVGRILDVLQRISPSLVDTILLMIGFNLQKTDELKRETEPSNLYEPIPGAYNTVYGDFGHLAVPSLSDWVNQQALMALETLKNNMLKRSS